MLAHKASHEGRTAVEHIAGHKVAFEPNAIPAVVFTDPEIAWAGLTETQAEKEGREIKVAKFPWAASGRAMSIQEVIEAFLGRARRPIETRQVPERVRPVDVPMLVGDAGRLRTLTGWVPSIPLRQSIEDVLEDWRRRV